MFCLSFEEDFNHEVENKENRFLSFQMPPSMSTSSFPMEKTFRRLLISTEKHLQDKSIEDWKIEQVRTK